MMDRRTMERWLYGGGNDRRRLQDSPILPDVWFAYALAPEDLGFAGDAPDLEPLVSDDAPHRRRRPRHIAETDGERTVDLLLRPVANSSASELAQVLDARLARDRTATELVYNEAYVAGRLTFAELIREALPLSEFWRQRLWPGQEGRLEELVGDRADELAAGLLPDTPREQGRNYPADDKSIAGNVLWLVGLVGRIVTPDGPAGRPPSAAEIVANAIELLSGLDPLGGPPDTPVLASVSRNRPVRTSVWRSRVTCKADAATTLFGLSCRDVRWAVIDSGVDARHPAFQKRAGDAPLAVSGRDPADTARSRILGTWDFSHLRQELIAKPLPPPPGDAVDADEDPEQRAQRLALQVARGRSVDWDAIAPLLLVPHDTHYDPPKDDHGTHVAGILIGDWRSTDDPRPGAHDLRGMCPDMEIYDLRAFDENGESDEFQILSAMQFVRHLNAHAEQPVVHGVNLSFSVQQDVDKYAAGGTPVCEEATRLIGSGVVVVAAAGNDGRGGYWVDGAPVDGYRTVSITDPGNAEKVITVGSTHREQPHTYGVSYFSSRGPTGDGRAKPDLVAPGEKITSAIPDAGVGTKDGTSQATPHVSGACAMLLARHPELIGQPEVVKQVILAACTDLGRERYFQGAGMLDVLRAIQAV